MDRGVESSRTSTPKIGFDEGEQREFSRALKQQLMVQTPLQVLLETLFSRLQAQALMFNDLSRKVERLEARDLDGKELLHRVQMCEGKLNDFTESKLSPFNQQEVLDRLEELEKKMDENEKEKQKEPEPVTMGDKEGQEAEASSTANLSSFQETELEARLSAVETKLAGVYNLTGKLIALEHMAEEIGVGVPDLEYNPGVNVKEFFTDGNGSAENMPSQTSLPSVSKSRPVSKVGAKSNMSLVVLGQKTGTSAKNSPVTTPRGEDHQARDVSPVKSGEEGDFVPRSGSRGALTSELSAQIKLITEETETLKMAVEALTGGLNKAQEEIDQLGSLSGTTERLDQLEASTKKSTDQLLQDLAVLKKGIKREPEVSFADFSLLQSKVEAATREVQTAKDAVGEIKENDVATLYGAIDELREAKEKVDAPRDMDTLFHQRISSMEGKLDDIRNEVQIAVSEVIEGVAKVSDLEELARELDSKASQQDIKQLAQQQAALAQSVNGMAEWLAVRPETADGAKGTGASMTKFKCLTCDREIKTQSVSNGNNILKGSFLPKLDSVRNSSPPGGSGYNTAEMRRSVKALNGSPIKGQEFVDYGTIDDARHKQKTTRTIDGRVALQMPAGGIKAPPGPKAPVFVA